MTFKEYMNKYNLTSIDIIRLEDHEGNVIMEFNPPMTWFYKTTPSELSYEIGCIEEEVNVNES